MFNSIYDDFKNTFRFGNMINKIILVNVVVFILIKLINVFDFNSGFSSLLIRKLSLMADPLKELFQPWSIISHMFLHVGFWHILWNMLLLYWFGRIVGDLLGDHRVLPLYLLGGFCGGIMFILWANIAPGASDMAFAYGASAAVWAIIMATTMLAPDYIFHLLLIGPVRIKYIALAMFLMDLISTGNNTNTGGFFGHMGGALFGIYFVYMLRKGRELTAGLQSVLDGIGQWSSGNQRRARTPRSTFKIIRNEEPKKKDRSRDEQSELDRILEKISKSGMESLSSEEKDFLFQVSKKK